MLNFNLLGYVEVGFLKRYPYPCPARNINAVVALAQAGNQIKLDWAGKLGQWPGQGGEKYFTSWEPKLLGQYFFQDSVIHRPTGAL